MRYTAFITHIRETFPTTTDMDLAIDISDAATDASRSDGGHIGSFEFEGVVYFVRTAWLDGCIKGDCNPATCYTDWTISTE